MTPWPKTCWDLSDQFYLDARNNFTSSLDTLYVAAMLPANRLETMDALAEEESMNEGLRDKHHIHGLSLYSLGVALLEIGHKRCFDMEDVHLVRSTARLKSSGIGYPYDDVVERCVWASFNEQYSTAGTLGDHIDWVRHIQSLHFRPNWTCIELRIVCYLNGLPQFHQHPHNAINNFPCPAVVKARRRAKHADGHLISLDGSFHVNRILYAT